MDRVTEVTMDEACEPETKQGNTYRVLVDLKALSRSIKESTEPKHRVQRYHAASVLRKASDSTDHMLELGPFDQKEYSGKPLGRRCEQGGMQTLRRVHREAATRANTWDVDIVNAHPTILSQLVPAEKAPCLHEYVGNRDGVLKSIMEWHEIEKKEAKELVLKIINHAQCARHAQHFRNPATFGWLSRLAKEARTIAKHVEHTHPEEFAALKKAKSGKETSAVCLLVQEIENRIAESAESTIAQLVEDYPQLSGVVLPLFDGMLVGATGRDCDGQDVDAKPEFPEEVLRECERVVEDDLGFRVTFAVKDVPEQPRDDNDDEDLGQVAVSRFRNPFHAHSTFPVKTCRQQWVKVKSLFGSAVLGKKAKPERQICIVSAPTGSGKSTCFGRQVYEDYGTGAPMPTPNGKTALIITARRSQADSFVRRFPGFVHYNHVDWEEQSRMDTSPARLIIQYESLHKLHRSSRVYQEIFCDEHRSLASQAVSVDTNRKNLNLNLQVARRLMARQSETTTRLMFSDADALLDPVGEWFVEAVADRGFREDTKVAEFRHDGQMQRGLRVYRCEESWLDTLLDTVKSRQHDNDKPVIVCFSQYESMCLVRRKLLHLVDPKDVLMYSGNDRSNANSLANVNEAWAAATVVMYTSTITVGLDYTGPCAAVFLHMERMGATAREMLQMGARARKPDSHEYTVFCQGDGGAFRPRPFEGPDPSSTPEYARALTPADPVLERIYHFCQEERRCIMYDPLSALLHACEYNRYPVVVLEEAGEGRLPRTGRELLRNVLPEMRKIMGLSSEQLDEEMAGVRRRQFANVSSYSDMAILALHDFKMDPDTRNENVTEAMLEPIFRWHRNPRSKLLSRQLAMARSAADLGAVVDSCQREDQEGLRAGHLVPGLGTEFKGMLAADFRAYCSDLDKANNGDGFHNISLAVLEKTVGKCERLISKYNIPSKAKGAVAKHNAWLRSKLSVRWKRKSARDSGGWSSRYSMEYLHDDLYHPELFLLQMQ